MIRHTKLGNDLAPLRNHDRSHIGHDYDRCPRLENANDCVQSDVATNVLSNRSPGEAEVDQRDWDFLSFSAVADRPEYPTVASAWKLTDRAVREL